MKLLTVDIGNTTIDFGLFSATKLGGSASGGENKKLIAKTKILTAKFSKIPFGNYDNAIIISVVPCITSKISRQLKNKPIIVNYKNIPIKIKVKKPEQVGADRLVNAVAVKEIYGCPSVVIDLGTATTLDFVSEKGEYLGGIIAPGIKISAEALFEKTAKLPLVSFQTIKQNLVIGKNTKEAILSGIFWEHIGLIKEVIKKIKNEKLKMKNLKVILTGGYAKTFAKHFPNFIVDEDLTLKGLEIVFEKLRSCPENARQ
ncbi:MAG: type III pantothenate kinase [Elusimicrobiota bacterium]